MFNLSFAPLTNAEWWQLVGAGIAATGAAIVLMVGLLWFWRSPEPYRENRRLSRIQHIVHWLGRHGGSWRVL